MIAQMILKDSFDPEIVWFKSGFLHFLYDSNLSLLAVTEEKSLKLILWFNLCQYWDGK